MHSWPLKPPAPAGRRGDVISITGIPPAAGRRAMVSSCFCLCEKFEASSSRSVAQPSGSVLIK
jgi:hypothetical protein